MRIAVCQMSSGSHLARNLADAAKLLGQAAAAGADVAILPENAGYLGHHADAPAPQPLDGEYGRFFATHAKTYGMWILAGSFSELGGSHGRVFNTSPLFDPQGQLVAKYRKIHRYDVNLPGQVVSMESRRVSAGDEPTVANIGAARLGMSICYDLRFPELYRQLVRRGAHILAVPAAFYTHTGKDHWEILLRARAIENQCFVAAAGQIGTDSAGKDLYGRSMIIDPWGTVLAQAPDRVGIAVADLDLAAQETFRTQFPCLNHRVLN